jgi:hypothetical protein
VNLSTISEKWFQGPSKYYPQDFREEKKGLETLKANRLNIGVEKVS